MLILALCVLGAFGLGVLLCVNKDTRIIHWND